MLIQTEEASERFLGHWFAVQGEHSAIVGLVHEAEHFKPDTAILERKGLDSGVFSPVAGIKLKGWEFH